MTLKELDIKLKYIVEHYISELPEFNTGTEFINIISRNKYASENKSFKSDIYKAVDEYLLDKENLTMREKEQWKNLKKYYEKKYEYGFNFPGGEDFYQSLFSTQ